MNFDDLLLGPQATSGRQITTLADEMRVIIPYFKRRNFNTLVMTHAIKRMPSTAWKGSITTLNTALKLLVDEGYLIVAQKCNGSKPTLFREK